MMSSHNYVECDRCGKRFEYRNEMWAAIIGARKLKKFWVIKLFYGNMSGYDYAEYDYDLCGECTKRLKEFLNEGEG